MTNLVTSRFPAVLIGGPPHAGKSVLARGLKESLSRAGIECYLLRAAPDGEGDWFHDAPVAVAQAERSKGVFTPLWIKRMCRDLVYRPLPFLVDVGGRPQPWQEEIFDQCSHAILLVKDAGSLATWQSIVERYNLIVLAILTSQMEDESSLETERPILQGTITGLIRGRQTGGPVFDALFERVKALFNYSHDELLTIHQQQAPAELVVDIAMMYRQLKQDKSGGLWQPEDLEEIFDYLPPDEHLALYGPGPAWLYAAVANFIYPHSFYQFDARLGWVAPVRLTAGPVADPGLTLATEMTGHALHLKLALPEYYLDYQSELSLPLPFISPQRGVILNGRLPNWLFTGLTLFYHDAAWVAVSTPQLDRAVIVAARDPGGQYRVGQTIPLID
ncbi:MAG: CRISPR-associated protein Csx3 [Chloroflexota bacterium]